MLASSSATPYPKISSEGSSPGDSPASLPTLGETIRPEDKQRLEDTAARLVRNPLSLEKLVSLDGQQAVLYRSRMNALLGRNLEALDPLE